METASNGNSEQAEYRFKPPFSTRPTVKPSKIKIGGLDPSAIEKVFDTKNPDVVNLFLEFSEFQCRQKYTLFFSQMVWYDFRPIVSVECRSVFSLRHVATATVRFVSLIRGELIHGKSFRPGND